MIVIRVGSLKYFSPLPPNITLINLDLYVIKWYKPTILTGFSDLLHIYDKTKYP